MVGSISSPSWQFIPGIYCLLACHNRVIFPITHYQNQNNPLRSFLLFSVSSCRQRLFWDPKWIDHQEVVKVHQGIFISEWLPSFGFDKTRIFFLNQASSETDFLLWPQQHGNCDELCHLLSSVFPYAMWCRCSFFCVVQAAAKKRFIFQRLEWSERGNLHTGDWQGG